MYQKDSFAFVYDVRKQNSKYYMTSFDIDSLFTNIPLEETINLCVEKVFKDKEEFKGMSKREFRSLLYFAFKDGFFLFNGKYYKQLDGVATALPLGPTLANVFLCHWEEKWLDKCPKQFSPKYYNRFMDDTFILFSCESHVKKFHKYLNSGHKNMTFTFEVEKGNSLPFLDVSVTRDDNKLVTSLYRKPTFSGLYSNFYSFMPNRYKEGLIKPLLHRAFLICFDWKCFHNEIDFLKKLFRKNLFPSSFSDRCIKEFLDKLFIDKKINFDVPKKDLRICIPYLGIESLGIRKNLNKLVQTYLPQCKLNVIFTSTNRIRNAFLFKDKPHLNVRSLLLYRYTCSKCNLAYIGKTKRHYLVRVFEHLGVSLRTGKNYKYNKNNINNSAVLNHINNKCSGASQEDFSIIGSANTDELLCIKESLLINKLKPELNTSVKSTPLMLFD